MALTPFTGTTDAAVINANFDDKTATITTQATAGRVDHTFHVYVASLTSATVLSLRQTTFAPMDDSECRIVMARGTADAIARTLVVTVAVQNGATKFINDYTITASVTSAGAGATDTRPTSLDLTSSTGRKFRFKRGVRYTLTIECTTAGTFTDAFGCIVLRSIRRRR